MPPFCKIHYNCRDSIKSFNSISGLGCLPGAQPSCTLTQLNPRPQLAVPNLVIPLEIRRLSRRVQHTANNTSILTLINSILVPLMRYFVPTSYVHRTCAPRTESSDDMLNTTSIRVTVQHTLHRTKFHCISIKSSVILWRCNLMMQHIFTLIN